MHYLEQGSIGVDIEFLSGQTVLYKNPFIMHGT